FDERQESRLDVAERFLGSLALGDQLAARVDAPSVAGPLALQALANPGHRAIPREQAKLVDRVFEAALVPAPEQRSDHLGEGLEVFGVEIAIVGRALDRALNPSLQPVALVSGGAREAASGPCANRKRSAASRP